MYGLRCIDQTTPCDVIVALANAQVPPPVVTVTANAFGVPIPDMNAITALARWTECTRGQILTPAGFTDCGNGVFVNAGSSCPAPPAPPAAAPPPAPPAAPAPRVDLSSPVLPAVNQCFRLFGGFEDCAGPIGGATLLLGLGVVAALWLFGGRK